MTWLIRVTLTSRGKMAWGKILRFGLAPTRKRFGVGLVSAQEEGRCSRYWKEVIQAWRVWRGSEHLWWGRCRSRGSGHGDERASCRTLQWRLGG